MPARTRIWFVAVVTSSALVLGSAGPAHAETAVQRVVRQRQEAASVMRAFRTDIDRHRDAVHARIKRANTVLATWQQIPLEMAPDGWPEVRATIEREIRDERRNLRALRRWERRRLGDMRRAYARLSDWLDTAGVFRACPVPNYTAIANNFGQIVRLPHVPVHVHMGNDVSASTWSPIVAPFDGYAWASTSRLGGLNVSVRGALGYVFNAHLAALGHLGYVRAGEVVGYVGATGDATGPHDHFEWHPWGGAAVDPYPFLVAACVSS